MGRMVRHIAAAFVLAACLCSCGSGEGKVIPRNKLARIYAEMFLADAWLMNAEPESRFKTDTAAFYEPIFEEYGYTVEDYWASVSHYLLDPDRFSRIVKKSNDMLTAELKVLEKLKEEEVAREDLRKGTLTEKVFELYGIGLDEPLITDRLNIQLDSNGRFVPLRIIEDTMYLGPRMIIAADTLNLLRDTLDTVTDTLAARESLPAPLRLRKPRR